MLGRLNKSSQAPETWILFGVLALAGLFCVLLEHWVPLVLPLGLGVVYLGIRDLRLLWLGCFAFIPLSTELQLGAFGLDVPVEPLMMLVTALGFVYALRRAGYISARAVTHPVTLLLGLHLFWIAFTAGTASFPVISWKFFLAKMWFVLPFFVMSGLLLRKVADMRKLILAFAVPMFFVMLYCLVRHASLGFSFEDVNKAMAPFFRNHVNYAALASISLPFVVLGSLLFPKGSATRRGLWILAAIMLLAIQTSFTRAAYVSILMGAGFVLIMHLRLVLPALLLAFAVAIGGVLYIVQDNTFFRFAPDYNKAISHYSFSDLMEATYKLEDASTMERVYRWVAGGYMVNERPWVGFGPGNFYSTYKGFALEAFRTYVSNNPEKSGIHNYYLMTLVEQGWPGLIIFLSLLSATLLSLGRAYSRARSREARIMASIAGASLVINLGFQLINDIIETDKAGPWFFLCLALAVLLDRPDDSFTERKTA